MGTLLRYENEGHTDSVIIP